MREAISFCAAFLARLVMLYPFHFIVLAMAILAARYLYVALGQWHYSETMRENENYWQD